MNDKKINKYVLIAFIFLFAVSIFFTLKKSYALEVDEDWYTKFTYVLNNENNTIELRRYTGTNQDVVIPATATIDNVTYNVVINGKTVIDDNTSTYLFASNTNIRSVAFADGIKVKDNLDSLFYNCTNLSSVTFGNIDATNLTSMRYMFYNTAITSIDVSGLRLNNEDNVDSSKLIDMEGMFYTVPNITSITFGNNFHTKNVKSMKNLFNGDTSLQSLDLSMFDTSNVTNMYAMFYNCSSLKNLDLSSFNTSKVTNMRSMFGQCSSLKTLNLSSFNTSEVTDMYGMFTNCSSLKSLDLSSFNTSKVTDMYGMFSTCKSLESLNVSSFDTSNVTNMAAMFYNCDGLEEIDLSNFNTINVTNMGSMFGDCSNLKKANLSSFNTPNVTNFRYMFGEDRVLEELDIRNLDTTNAPDLFYMFYYSAISLKKITFGPKYNSKYTQTKDSCPFGRGVWRKDDGTLHNAVDLTLQSENQSIAGTYTKVSNIIDEMNIDYAVDYKVEKLNKIDHFDATSDIFELDGDRMNVYIKDLRPIAASASSDGYTFPGDVTLTFDNVVTKSTGEKYNLQVKIENIRVYDINEDENDGDTFKLKIAYVHENKKNLYLINQYRPNDLSKFIYEKAAAKYDVTIKIVDENGNPQQGTYLFSVGDLDIPGVKDYGNIEAHSEADGTKIKGYGDTTEGVNFTEGYDISTLKMYSHTELIFEQLKNRIFGKHIDENTEFTEFSIKVDASNLKFTWTTGAHCDSALMQNYQPQVVSIIKKNVDGNVITGATLELYNSNSSTPIETWTTGSEYKKVFLMPGRYTIKETSVPTGYKKIDDLTFYVDIDDTLTIDGRTVSEIVVTDPYQDYQYTVNYIDVDTNKKIKDSKVSSKAYRSTVNVLDENVSIDNYQYINATNKDNGTISSITISMNESDNIINLYYKTTKMSIIVKYVDKYTNNEIDTSSVITLSLNDPYDVSSLKRSLESLGYYFDSATDNLSGVVTEDGIEVIYYYRKVHEITVSVADGIGGKITGSEEVLAGNNSTKDYIKITADTGYIISSITINDTNVPITNEKEMILSNFEDVREDKNVVVKFEKNIIDNVPITGINSNIVVYIFTALILIATGFFLYYKKQLNK